jgi:hypothetical protein
MQGNGNRGGEGNRSEIRPHEEYLELCAISTTGELSKEEQEKLRAHLATCPACRQALQEFEAVTQEAIPLLSEELLERGSNEAIPAPARCDDVEIRNRPQGMSEISLAHRNGRRDSHLSWNYVWVPFAAAILLTAALGIYSYDVGRSRGLEVVETKTSPVDPRVDALEQQLSDVGHDRETLKAELTERDRTIGDLRREIEAQSAALGEAKSAEASLEKSLESEQTESQQVAQEKSGVQQKLDAAQESLEKTQAQLDSAERERQQEEVRAGSLEAQIKDLYGQLKDREQTIGKQQDLLADDRDIRELMGARDLYIAEVYDVARDGSTEKPYGRVFYTKGKSLVFYAYDLDQQPGIKGASSFQAWGQSGPDRQEALSLGIFYLDSAAKKRWVVKFDDPRTLEQIDAVFVTVEPHGGSHRPDGKPLLYASLRIEPNHP